MSKSIDDLKFFIKEMFQFNENDLDFGIYKIYNLKREQIENFINGEKINDLVPTIEEIINEVSIESLKADSLELSNFLKWMNQDALLDSSEINYDLIKTFISTEQDITKKSRLLDILERYDSSQEINDTIKEKIYNHILSFFQLYYSNGDFGYNNRSTNLYKMGYEADYNGSDIMFHWKHKGSLYTKSASSFNAIKFSMNEKNIEFRLETNEESENEEVSRNNNKDDQLKHYQLNRVEEIDGTYNVVFNLAKASTSKVEIFKEIYEHISHGMQLEPYLTYLIDKKDGTKETKNIFIDLSDDFDKIKNGQVKGLSSLRQNKKNVADKTKKNFERGTKLYDEISKKFLDNTLNDLYTLDQKLNSFYIGHDSDYFIHENLKTFLTYEKERYIKNFIFDTLEDIYSGSLDNTTILIAKAFDKVASRIIEFLASIEDFQKHLFTKKKKVVQSEYCVTLDYIDEKYYPEILSNKYQIDEWNFLFSVDVSSIEDLKNNPTMVLDTKFFQDPTSGKNFLKDKILSDIDDLEDKCNGLLINTENYQALNLLQEKFYKKIACVYADPPYNAPASSIIYKNHFKHSSWVTLMENRIKLAAHLKSNKGALITAIDKNEFHNLIQLLQHLFPNWEHDNISIVHNPAGVQGDNFSYSHEYAIFSYEPSKNIIAKTLRDEVSQESFRDWGGTSARDLAKNCFYPIIVENGEIIEFGDVCDDEFHPNSSNIRKDGKVYVYPVSEDGVERKWVFARQSVEEIEYELEVKESKGIISIARNKSLTSHKTVWSDKKFYANIYGSKLLNNILGNKKFDFPKSIHTMEECIKALSSMQLKNSYCMDYFAGSGTTGHAIINLNKEDDANRKYILTEMGTYFDSVTKPRIQKVIYSSNWKQGKPNDNNGSLKHIFKYQVLEQYEDILDNLHIDKRESPRDLPIKYLYKPEINKLAHDLDIFNPFTNRIKYGKSSSIGFVDLVETYNYLSGYFIKTIKCYTINGKYYKVVETPDGVLIIWRNIVINEDDSSSIIEILDNYQKIHTIEVNAEFATLQLDNHNYLKVGDKEINVIVIHNEVFNN